MPCLWWPSSTFRKTSLLRLMHIFYARADWSRHRLIKLPLSPGMEVSPVAALAMLEILNNLFKAEVALP